MGLDLLAQAAYSAVLKPNLAWTASVIEPGGSLRGLFSALRKLVLATWGPFSLDSVINSVGDEATHKDGFSTCGNWLIFRIDTGLEVFRSTLIFSSLKYQ